MDLLTQGLLGAAVARSAAPARERRIATGVGFAAGLLPDADTLIRSPSDPLLFLDFHRHFSHSLVMVPVVALVAAAMLWPFLRGRLHFGRLYGYALLGCALAGVLDASTSYGTHLLWPFSERPVAWSIVAIVDPVVSLVLVAGVVLGLRRESARGPRIALAAVALYLMAGALQHERAEDRTRALAASRGHEPERILVKPTVGNLLLWRSLYVHGIRIHADGIRLPPFGAATVYPGASAALVREDDIREPGDPAAAVAPEFARFARFADALVVRHPRRPEMLGDARYAMLPTSLEPLWGIAPGAAGGPHPVEFVTDRRLGPEDRRRFLDMLLGRERP